MKTILAAISLALIPVLGVSAGPASAQDMPFSYGDYWEMTEVTVEDGSAFTYIQFLAGQWKKQQEFAKSKGWIKEYHLLGNINKRPGEPDFYLVSVFSKMPDGKEAAARDKAYDDYFKTTMQQSEQESGQRAKYRRVIGSQLLGELVLK